jgi:hypothetical protein
MYHFITIAPMFITFLWGSMITYQWVFERFIMHSTEKLIVHSFFMV